CEGRSPDSFSIGLGPCLRRDTSLNRPVLALAIPHRGAAQGIAFTPFLLALFQLLLHPSMLGLPGLARLDFILIARLPFAAAAGGQEYADQQAEQEDQSADHPQVRIRRDAHLASPIAA